MANQVLDRRRFLSMGIVAAGAAMFGGDRLASWFPASVDSGAPRWSDPATWGGSVPRPGQWVSVDRTIILDTNVDVGGLAIQPGGALVFDPSTSATLSSTKNIVVLGVLQMRPSSASVEHRIRFTGIDESAFVGGGHNVLETDVGLWCLHDGIIDVAGSPRRAWARTTSGVAQGASSLTLQIDPVGWQVGDEIAIAPTLGPEHRDHFDAYDYATVTSISGNTVGLSAPTRFAHPSVDVGNGIVVAPEVMNLTRNVNIEGTPGGRAHIMFVHSGKPQHMSYFGTRWMGPRQRSGDFTASVLGRYALHFHMVGDASRGSTIVGGVVRDAGAHAFVAHESHGVTFSSCVSHDTFEAAYWWDGAPDTRTPGPPSHDVLYEACIASRVRTDPAFRGFRLSGFDMNAGNGNRALDCVAVGVQGNVHASGFHWPEGSDGVWDFRRNISHNNKCNGMFTWQNSRNLHVIEDFVCYHNGTAGINHGAYLTSYLYRNGYLFRNGHSALELHSNSYAEAPQRFVGLRCEAAPGTEHAVRVVKHTLEPGRPSEFVGCTFNGQSRSAIGFVYDLRNGATTRELFDVIHCQSSSPLLWFRDDTHRDSLVRVQSEDEVVVARPITSSGTPRPEWNALVTPIDRFADDLNQDPSRPFVIVGGSAMAGSSQATEPALSTPTTTTSVPTESTTTTAEATESNTTTSTTTSTTIAASTRAGGRGVGRGGRKPGK